MNSLGDTQNWIQTMIKRHFTKHRKYREQIVSEITSETFIQKHIYSRIDPFLPSAAPEWPAQVLTLRGLIDRAVPLMVLVGMLLLLSVGLVTVLILATPLLVCLAALLWIPILLASLIIARTVRQRRLNNTKEREAAERGITLTRLTNPVSL